MDNHSHETWMYSGRAVRFMKHGAACATILAVLGGCAATSGGKPAKDIVAERAQQRWELLVKNDFPGAYRYMSSAGKQIVTEQAYAASFRRNFWTSAKVSDVQCQTEEACEVDVMIEYQHLGMKMKTGVREKWVRDKSNWWFLLER